MSAMLGIIALAIILCTFRYIIYKKNIKRMTKLINEFPGPRSYPIIGTILMFVGSPADVIRKGLRIFIRYNSPVRLWMMHKPLLVIYDPENFQIVTKSVCEKEDGYTYLRDFLGEGLITVSGEKWKTNRRLLHPAFNPHLLHNHFLTVFHEENSKLIKMLDIQADKNIQFDLWPHIFHCTLNTITMTAMNYRDEVENDLFEYGNSLLKASALVTQRIYQPWLYPDMIYNFYKIIKGYSKAFNHLHKLPKTIIERKKKEFESQQGLNEDHGDGQNYEENVTYGRMPKTFIDILLNDAESKAHFSNDELTDEIVTIIFAGSETTTIAICSTLSMLAMHQQCQDKIYEEIKNVIGDHERNVEIQHLHQLTFLEQCIKESLRLFSIIPFVLRTPTEDIKLNDGRIIPAGVTVCLAISLLHTNPHVYANPLKWNPDNFSPENIAKRHPYSFAPFSKGPRTCIGNKYGMLSIKVMIVTILRRYKLHTNVKPEEIKMTFNIAMKNIKGYHVRLEKRVL